MSVCVVFRFFREMLTVSIVQVLPFLGYSVPEYFIVFGAIVNGMVFFISFSDVSSIL